MTDARERDLLESTSDSPQTLALDDPVPSGSCIADVRSEQCATHPHDVEAEVQRVLTGTPDLEFSSLVVRRVPQGVCLEGVLHSNSRSSDLADLVRTVAGVDVVINHLLVCVDR